MIVTRFALPTRSPIPLIVPCTCVAPPSTAVSVFATAQPESSWVWIPSATSGSASRDDRQRDADLRRQRAPVGVAQHDPLGPRVGRGAQRSPAHSRDLRRSRRRSARRRAARACRVAIRNATDSAIIFRFSSRETLTTFSTCSTEVLPTSVHTGAKDSARIRSPSSCVRRRPRAGASSRTRRSPRSRNARSASSSNSCSSFGFDDGKTRLDHVHAERVERVHDAQLLLRGQAHAAAAHAVAQGRVV